MTANQEEYSLVIGAGSRIAQAIITQELAARPVIAVSRKAIPDLLASCENLQWLESDYSEESMAKIARQLQQEDVTPQRIFICNGKLHDAAVTPEKRLENLSLESLQAIYQANAFTPILWMKYLKALISSSVPCNIIVFSARVGSIADNAKGGWYAYRSSKAALNMLLKTMAIELGRIRKAVRVLAFHPGTTDTPLSEPFQGNVPRDKLFTPEFVASQLDDIVEQMQEGPLIQFLDWQGKPVPW